MLNEQIIKFELKGPGSPGRTCTLITGQFYDKIKISKKNRRVGYYLLLKYCGRQCNLLSPTWAKSLTKFNTKMRDFKRVLNYNCKSKEV